MDLLLGCHYDTDSNDSESSNDSSDCNDKHTNPTEDCVNHDPQEEQTASNPNNNKPLFTRNVPHIRGNWCGHIFLDIDPTLPHHSNISHYLNKAAHVKLQTLHRYLSHQCNSQSIPIPTIHPHVPPTPTGTNPATPPNHPHEPTPHHPPTSNRHISLSRPFYLQKQSIEPFLHHLQQSLQMEYPIRCSLDTSEERLFTMAPQDILVNDSNTRSFVTLSSPTVSSTSTSTSTSIYTSTNTIDASFHRIIDRVNRVMKRYNQPVYYSDPKLHVSIASMTGNVRELLFPPEKRPTLDSSHGVPCKHDRRKDDVGMNDLRQKDSSSGEEEDDHIDGDDDDDLEYVPDILPIQFHQVVCTFGTTKRFSLKLRQR